MLLLGALSTSWGVRSRLDGKTVWFRLVPESKVW